MFDLGESHCSLKLFSSRSLFLVFDSILDYSSGKRGNNKHILRFEKFLSLFMVCYMCIYSSHHAPVSGLRY